ncbi:MAG: hypothetical protein K6E77_11855 [Lachnospiraceae bacterium]|nr:hypothetical protein [Lachnospiraceae bacterium]
MKVLSGEGIKDFALLGIFQIVRGQNCFRAKQIILQEVNCFRAKQIILQEVNCLNLKELNKT